MTQKIFWAIAVLVCLSSCGKKAESNKEETEPINSHFLKSVKTVKSTLGNQTGELMLTGKVECDPEKVVSYVPLISGIVERTYFSLGDKVQKGQKLLDIKSTDLNQLQTDYVTAESSVKVAERELESTQSMYDDKMASEIELMEAKAKLKQAKAELEQAKSDLSGYGFNKDHNNYSVKSPINGYIIDKQVSSGSPVSSDNGPLFVVADLSEVWIMVNVYAGNLQFVHEGMDVDISILSYPNEIFKGKIDRLSQVFDPEEKVLKARIRMSNADLKFKPEMSAVIKVKSESAERLVTIPSDAVIFDDNHYFVIVEENTSSFKIKPIEIQGKNNNMSYIKSGLDVGEAVVIKNQLLIYSGLKEQ